MFHGWWRERRESPRAATSNDRTSRPGVEALEDRLLMAADLLADIHQITASAFSDDVSVGSAVRVGDIVYFTADDGEHVNALYKTDGTAEGTVLVKAIGQASTPGTTIAHLTAYGNKILFTVDDGKRGDELWISDGSKNGTNLLLDINKQPAGTDGAALIPGNSFAADLVVVADKVFFTADDGTHGRELWVTNGTTAGTYMVEDVNPVNTQPVGSVGPSSLTRYRGKVYFWATDDEHGRELWVSDGTKDGTRMVRDINDGEASGSPRFYTVTDAAHDASASMAVVGGQLYFAANNGVHGVELWKTDGSASGTGMVRNVNRHDNSGPDSNPRNLTAVGGRLFFVADNGNIGRQLWISDGSSAGTRRLTTLVLPNVAGAHAPRELTEFQGKLYFTATTENGGEGLFVSDGTVAGTGKLRDLSPLIETDTPPDVGLTPPEGQNLFVVGSTLYFTAVTDAHGRELWATNGTPDGTRLVRDIRPGAAGSQIQFLSSIQGQVLFAASNGDTGRELWVSDGTSGNTHLVKDLNQLGGDANPTPPVKAGDWLFFVADDGKHGAELWVADAFGVEMVKNINTAVIQVGGGAGDFIPAGSEIRDLVAVGNRVYFVANDGVNGEQVWVSDGTANGTIMVRPLDDLTGISDLTAMGNQVYFVAEDGDHGRELWVSNGTSDGTHVVKDLYTREGNAVALSDLDADEQPSANPSGLVAVNNQLYFAANDGHHGRELWVTDGTAQGTRLLKNINQETVGANENLGPARSANPTGMTRVGAAVFFAANDGQSGVELWKTDGTTEGTRRVKDLNKQRETLSSSPRDIVAVGDLAYFLADDGVHGPSLYRSDGAKGGTVLLRSFGTDENGDVTVRELTAVGSRLFFVAETRGRGAELWSSDGTAEGTKVVRDIFPGRSLVGEDGLTAPNSSNPTSLTAFNGKLYFVAEDGVHGRELWVSDGTTDGTRMKQEFLPGRVGGLDSTMGLVAIGDRLYFGANDGVHGYELWEDEVPVVVVEPPVEATEEEPRPEVTT